MKKTILFNYVFGGLMICLMLIPIGSYSLIEWIFVKKGVSFYSGHGYGWYLPNVLLLSIVTIQGIIIRLKYRKEKWAKAFLYNMVAFSLVGSFFSLFNCFGGLDVYIY